MPSEGKKNTSWQHVAGWYSELVGDKGHYYHRQIVIPGVLRLLNLKPSNSLLDVGCGQGVMSRAIPEGVDYHGIDLSKSLLAEAKKSKHPETHNFTLADATKKFNLPKNDFSHACIILALQDMESPRQVFVNINHHLGLNGRLVFVIRHPSFRIPGKSDWHIDREKNIQSRIVNCYMSPQKIPIEVAPSKESRSPKTWAFHLPLSAYTQHLLDAGFALENIEEWVSDKQSVGKAALMENRARSEFPLFMAIIARKSRKLRQN